MTTRSRSAVSDPARKKLARQLVAGLKKEYGDATCALRHETPFQLLIATILGWSVAMDAIAFRWPALRGLLKSSPSPLIVDGQINKRALRREFMSRDELMAELRLRGITDVRKVARAYLEPNGMVSVIRADEAEVDDPPKPPAAG